MSINDRINALRKGKKHIDEAKEQPVDANAVILGNFLRGYVAVEEFGPGVTVMTTDDIISALADMADLTQSEVNRVLATIGFKPGRNTAGSFGCLMKRIEL